MSGGRKEFPRFRDDPERPDAGVAAPTPSLATKPYNGGFNGYPRQYQYESRASNEAGGNARAREALAGPRRQRPVPRSAAPGGRYATSGQPHRAIRRPQR